MANWFYLDNGLEIGPLTADELKTHADYGKLNHESLVKIEGTKKWHPASQVNGLGLSKPAFNLEIEPEVSQPTDWVSASPPAPGTTDRSAGIKPSDVLSYVVFAGLDCAALAFANESGTLPQVFGAMLVCGILSLILGAILKKRDLVMCLLIGCTFSVFALIAIPFMEREHGER